MIFSLCCRIPPHRKQLNVPYPETMGHHWYAWPWKDVNSYANYIAALRAKRPVLPDALKKPISNSARLITNTTSRVNSVFPATQTILETGPPRL